MGTKTTTSIRPVALGWNGKALALERNVLAGTKRAAKRMRNAISVLLRNILEVHACLTRPFCGPCRRSRSSATNGNPPLPGARILLPACLTKTRMLSRRQLPLVGAENIRASVFDTLVLPRELWAPSYEYERSPLLARRGDAVRSLLQRALQQRVQQTA